MSIYDEIEIEDMTYRPAERTFYYPCPCGDRFFIAVVSATSSPAPGCRCHRPSGVASRRQLSLARVLRTAWQRAPRSPPAQDELLSGEDVAKCPSCSLQIRVVFDPDGLEGLIEAAEAAAAATGDASGGGAAVEVR
jgi:hypothetical protein